MKLQDRANGLIRILTMSPEYEGSSDFIKRVSRDMIVSIGHTAATPEQIRLAADHGATMSTHLGNGMHRELVRHPNYLWEQLADDRLAAGLIGDGVHLDSSVMKSMVRAKGVENCFLVSDSTLLSGMATGLYRNSALGDVEVTEDRRLVIAGQRALNAGAYRPLKDAMQFLVQNDIASPQDVMAMMSDNPLRIISEKGQLGANDDFVNDSFLVFELGADHSLRIEMTVVDGDVVYRA